jgi:hypothetical protein
MVLISGSVAAPVTAQRDGILIRKYTLLIIIPLRFHWLVSIGKLIAGNVIRHLSLRMLNLNVLIVIMMYTRQLLVPIVPVVTHQNHGWWKI